MKIWLVSVKRCLKHILYLIDSFESLRRLICELFIKPIIWVSYWNSFNFFHIHQHFLVDLLSVIWNKWSKYLDSRSTIKLVWSLCQVWFSIENKKMWNYSFCDQNHWREKWKLIYCLPIKLFTFFYLKRFLYGWIYSSMTVKKFIKLKYFKTHNPWQVAAWDSKFIAWFSQTKIIHDWFTIKW